MKKILLIILLITLGIISFYFYNNHIIKNAYTKNDGDYVVLLHGLGRSSFSMQSLGVQLSQEGYKVVNINYSSKKTVEDLVNTEIKNIILNKCTDENKKINFVTHSMGGIIVRYLLQDDDIKNVGRIVMLAPPNQGSDLASKFSSNKIIRYLLGPALAELVNIEDGFINTLIPLDNEIGIIAGKYDKKVSLVESQLPEMKDFIIVPKTHTWIMHSEQVINLVINFLLKGNFSVL